MPTLAPPVPTEAPPTKAPSAPPSKPQTTPSEPLTPFSPRIKPNQPSKSNPTSPRPSPLYDPDTVREPQRVCPQQRREFGWEAI